MTLIDAILKAKPSVEGKYTSPPPEVVDFDQKIKIKRVYKYAHVPARVDSSPPRYDPQRNVHMLQKWRQNLYVLNMQNVRLLMSIRRAHYMKGRVDSHWDKKPVPTMLYYQHRVDFLKRTRRYNLAMYHRILSTNARVDTTADLNRDWCHNKHKIVEQASNAFVLFSPIFHEEMEDLAFKAKVNVKRPRVYLKLGMQNGAVMGEICVELFTDVCPNTCRLFLELTDGDCYGHGYVNTCFFRKVPHLYWTGGDVIYNNGFGCYAQCGREVPIGAENYHYPHSMPGLLSMRVTVDDEMCGIFNITFKPLPQLDLRNVVFGRVIRPSSTYNIISKLGNAISNRPVVEIRSARRRVEGRRVEGRRVEGRRVEGRRVEGRRVEGRRVEGRWVHGAPNTELAKRSSARLRKILMT